MVVINQAVASRLSPQPEPFRPSQSDAPINRESNPHQQQHFIPNGYKLAKPQIRLGRLQLREIPPRTIAEWIAKVVREESPIHFEEVVRRIREEAGLERAGEAIRDAIRNGARFGAERGKFISEGDFFWNECIHAVAIRNRANFPSTYKKLEFVHSAEIKAAIIQAVRDSYGISRQDVGTSATRLLGFERTTENMCERIEYLIDELIRENTLSERSGKLQLLEPTPS